MAFRLQYLDATTGKWLELGQTANSGMLKVGSAAARGSTAAASRSRAPRASTSCEAS